MRRPIALWVLVLSLSPLARAQEAAVEELPRESLDGPPIVSCKAWAIADGKSGELLWGGNEEASLQIASTTKIMTALLVLELAKSEPAVLEEVVTISERADKTSGSSAGVRAGEQFPVRDLLYGLLLPSGNDAAVALGEHFGPRLAGDGSVSGRSPNLPAAGGNGDGAANEEPAEADSLGPFVEAMNGRAAELEMSQTKYLDPHGNSANRASARDLLRLVWRAMQNESFRAYVKTRGHTCIVDAGDGTHRDVSWKNTNQLLGIGGYDGVKTGTTGGAGACLISSGHREGDHLLMVVLGSTSKDGRYVDSRNLYRWAWRERGHK
jgi:D-alanyl-D-alanine carboxypeptidase (penicillin-binding protein 5/6)